MRRFVDTNIFLYAILSHSEYGETVREILDAIEAGEAAVTSTLVLCEIAWVLESMGRQGKIKPTLEKILSFGNLEVADLDSDDLLVGANYMALYRLDFNDGVNIAIMERMGITEAYSNDEKHLGRVDFIRLVFERK